MFPFVDVDDARLLAAARPNHLRRHGFRDELLFESQQRLQTAGLRSILVQTNLLQAQLLQLLFEFAVFGPYPAQVKVVVPEVAGAGLHPDQYLLEGSYGADCPDANQAGRLGVGRALDLNSKSKHLGEEDCH